jgi:hypothetical protein
VGEVGSRRWGLEGGAWRRCRPRRPVGPEEDPYARLPLSSPAPEGAGRGPMLLLCTGSPSPPLRSGRGWQWFDRAGLDPLPLRRLRRLRPGMTVRRFHCRPRRLRSSREEGPMTRGRKTGSPPPDQLRGPAGDDSEGRGAMPVIPPRARLTCGPARPTRPRVTSRGASVGGIPAAASP